MTKYLYNPQIVDARYPHQQVTCIKPDESCYLREMAWARRAIHAGDMLKDPFHQMPSRVVNDFNDFCEAFKALGYGGIEMFIDKDGTLYKVHQDPAFDYAPLEYDGQHDWTGINWATAWFFTEEAALAFNKGKPEYHEDLGTWSVHYHRYR